jgi:hypothetical protein
LLTATFAVNPLPDLPVIFSAFSIRRKQNGEIDLLELLFPIITIQCGARLLDDPEIKPRFEGEIPRGAFVYYFGRTVPMELAQTLNADLPDSTLLGKVDDVFEAIRAVDDQCRDEIGGPIDVAAIESHGFRWLRKKPIQL